MPPGRCAESAAYDGLSAIVGLLAGDTARLRQPAAKVRSEARFVFIPAVLRCCTVMPATDDPDGPGSLVPVPQRPRRCALLATATDHWVAVVAARHGAASADGHLRATAGRPEHHPCWPCYRDCLQAETPGLRLMRTALFMNQSTGKSTAVGGNHVQRSRARRLDDYLFHRAVDYFAARWWLRRRLVLAAAPRYRRRWRVG